MVKKTPSKTTKKSSKSTKTTKKNLNGWIMAPRQASTMNDVKTAVLLVSLTINAFIFIGWLILKLTSVYDEQVYSFLFNR